VSYNMSGWRTFRELLRNPKSDVAVLLITFFLTVIFDLTVAIEFGLVLACLLFIKRVMETTEVNLFKDEIIPTDADGTVISESICIFPTTRRSTKSTALTSSALPTGLKRSYYKPRNSLRYASSACGKFRSSTLRVSIT
jgi:MFS superfamily sulfate permease-like transporter